MHPPTPTPLYAVYNCGGKFSTKKKCSHFIGLYYKLITIIISDCCTIMFSKSVIDDSRSIIDDCKRRPKLWFHSLLTSVVMYDRNIFVVQANGFCYSNTQSHSELFLLL
jgi:hypothetical protein